MSRASTEKKPGAVPTPLSPEEGGHPVVEVYEGLVDGRKIATVSLTADRQTWIAGWSESQSDAYIGSFASLDEAKYAVCGRLPPYSKPVHWVGRKVNG